MQNSVISFFLINLSMRKILFYFLFQMCSLFVFAQGNTDSLKVPQNILDKFRSWYPNAKDVKWSKSYLVYDSITYPYGVNFEIKPNDIASLPDTNRFINQVRGSIIHLFFNDNGLVTFTQIIMPDSLMPKEIHDYLSENYKGYITGEDKYKKYFNYAHPKRNHFRYVIYDEREAIDSKGNASFALRITIDKKGYLMFFDGNGKFVHKVKAVDI